MLLEHQIWFQIWKTDLHDIFLFHLVNWIVISSILKPQLLFLGTVFGNFIYILTFLWRGASLLKLWVLYFPVLFLKLHLSLFENVFLCFDKCISELEHDSWCGVSLLWWSDLARPAAVFIPRIALPPCTAPAHHHHQHHHHHRHHHHHCPHECYHCP